MRNQHIFLPKSLHNRNFIPTFADEIGEDRLRSAIEASFIALASTIIAIAIVHNEELCTRADTDVRGVESGSSILIMKNDEDLSEFTLPQRWRGFLFHVLFIMGFARTLLLDTWMSSPRHS